MRVQRSVLTMVLLILLSYCVQPAEGKMLGGLTVKRTDRRVREIANAAARQIGGEYSLISIKKAKYQVVAGKLYHININLSKTGMSLSKVVSCKVKILDPLTGGTPELKEFCCKMK
ncbi:uncharacterized protein LOC127880167 isoform X2 [Dreissena polymorpha]|uniref:uncharacterized protein LOC127880167 isoform X2 n=1 Tax=Dreissena polymorpha TaxID=45954 RepID=UPI00226410A1|nr:uncharacterized protein LOC127880167 isoform X2 [Dreissena polymorpha]